MGSTTHTPTRTEQRAIAAFEDVVAVEDVAPGMVRVVTWSDAHMVDARDGGCMCEDKQYRGVPMCKHELAALTSDVDRLPAAGMVVDSLDERTEVATDGGSERPDDCECWDVDAELPCWACARDGFDAQNPAEPAADDADEPVTVEDKHEWEHEVHRTMGDRL